MFFQGFYEMVPQYLLRNFHERELELLLCGMNKINVSDWRKHTNVVSKGVSQNKKTLTKTDEVTVEWFWRAVENFTDEQRSRSVYC